MCVFVAIHCCPHCRSVVVVIIPRAAAGHKGSKNKNRIKQTPPLTRVCERGCWVTVEGQERFFLALLLGVSVLSPVRCCCNLVVSRKKTGGRCHLPACRACLPSLSPLL